jgi:hypothetical protein
MGVHQLEFTVLLQAVVVTIGFDATAYYVLEGARLVNVSIVLTGLSDRPLSVVLNTRDGTTTRELKGVIIVFLRCGIFVRM